MDDVPEKLRRNLVVVSSFIIASWWLQWDLSNGPAIQALKGTAEVTPWRFWLATLLVLNYLWYRFHLSKPRRTTWQKLQEEVRKAINTERLECIVKNERDHIKNGAARRFGQVGERLPSRISGLTSLKLTAVHWNDLGSTKHPRRYDATINLVSVEKERGQSTSYAIEFAVPRRVARAIFLDAVGKVLIRSNDWLEVGVPYVLAYTAYFICLFRLISSIDIIGAANFMFDLISQVIRT